MAWYRIAENVLDAIANAINAKTGKTAPMTPVEMVSEIQSIQTGGEKVYTKLAEATVSEAVNSLYITMTNQILTCEVLYLVIDSITLSQEDWLYPTINGTDFGYLKTATTFSTTVIFAPIRRPSGITKCASVAQQILTNNRGTEVNSFQKVGVHPYEESTNIQSGKIEVWGYV